MITPDQFATALDSLKDYWGVIGMFGGNPATHPKFAELCEIMRDKVPFVQRGLWCNHPRGKGNVARITFNPLVSNLNVHLDREAHEEFRTSWPECTPVLKGLDQDSRHSPPYVALKDVVADRDERWRLIEDCDINKYWSSMICVFREELRAFFCEIAGAQAMLHQNDPKYPDTGLVVTPNWWQQAPAAFEHQVEKHCHECGIPLKGRGDLAVLGKVEQVSKTHLDIYQLKTKGREVQLVHNRSELGSDPLPRVTDYIENGRLK
jgi:hypothetical protein